MIDRRTFAVSLAALLAACQRASGRDAALPELGELTPFSLRDQNGKPVTRESFQGKVWVAAFMFTRCPSVCPRITRRMKAVQDTARERKLPIQLVSFSVDPEHDTPQVLAKYAAEYGADTSSWSFLTGPYAVVAETAEKGFKIGLSGKADPEKEDLGITHGSHLILVDGSSTIRGYYRTMDDEAVEALLNDAARLVD